MAKYDAKFYDERSRETPVADAILSTVLPIIKPRSVVDLGTAVGTWLASAKTFGVGKVVGIDGPWVPDEQLLIPPSELIRADLEGQLPEIDEPFDLAICTEVLEHISDPAGERAVSWLCRRAPAVLFSAAIPGQGGKSHINELWMSTWAERFAAHGFKAYDVVRPKIWGNPIVPFWYQQNLLLFARDEVADKFGLTPIATEAIDVVHPDLFKYTLGIMSGLEDKIEAKRIRNRLRRALG